MAMERGCRYLDDRSTRRETEEAVDDARICPAPG